MAKRPFNFNQYRNEVWKQNIAELGEGVYPSWEEKKAYWLNRIKTFVPRGYMYVFDIKKGRTVLSHGLSVLGYSDDKELSMFDITSMTHENQRNILLHLTTKIHHELAKVSSEVLIKGGFYYGVLRAIKDTSDKYWLAYQTSEPFQFDINNSIVSYLSWFHIIGKYKGEPPLTEFFHKEKDKFSTELNKLSNKMIEAKEEILRYMGFTDSHLHIMTLLSKGISIPEIAEIRKRSVKTISNQCTEINAIAKDNFPLDKFTDVNNFMNVKLVAIYLKKMDLLHYPY